MALIEEEPKHSVRALLAVGIPSFMLAVAVSLLTHQYAHVLVTKISCGAPSLAPAVRMIDYHAENAACALGALAGPVWTFGLGLAFFALMLRHPHNLFFAAMAFVNATLRLPETLTVFFQLLVHNAAQSGIDEGSSLALLRLHDQTIPTVIMCFYSIMLVFFAVIVIHDIRRVPHKWVAAVVLFLVLGFIEQAVWSLVGLVFT